MFVLPAHAHEAEIVEPRSTLCDDPGGCMGAMAVRTKFDHNSYFDVSYCPNHASTHKHYNKVYLRYYVCVNSWCDYYNLPVPDTYTTSSTEYCIYG